VLPRRASGSQQGLAIDLRRDIIGVGPPLAHAGSESCASTRGLCRVARVHATPFAGRYHCRCPVCEQRGLIYPKKAALPSEPVAEHKLGQAGTGPPAAAAAAKGRGREARQRWHRRAPGWRSPTSLVSCASTADDNGHSSDTIARVTAVAEDLRYDGYSRREDRARPPQRGRDHLETSDCAKPEESAFVLRLI
jgi:hypothetical protein